VVVWHHANHGRNMQVITAPDGWPLWTSDVRPGREHDTTALPTHTEILPALTAWITVKSGLCRTIRRWNPQTRPLPSVRRGPASAAVW